MPITTSIELLEQVRAHSDEQAWHRFLETYQPFVENWLRQQNVDKDLCQDIQQEVICVLLRDLERFDHNGNKGAFRCWLRKIAANQLRTARRKHSNRNLVYLNGMADSLEDDHSELSKLWDREHNRFIVRTLIRQVAVDVEPKTLKAFERLVLDEYSPDDVADELQMSRASVITAKSRVMRILKQRAILLEFD